MKCQLLINKFSFLLLLIISANAYAGGQPDPEMVPPVSNSLAILDEDREFSATFGFDGVTIDVQTGNIVSGQPLRVVFNSPANVETEPFQDLIATSIESVYYYSSEIFDLLDEPIDLLSLEKEDGFYLEPVDGYLYGVKNGRISEIIIREGDEKVKVQLTYDRQAPDFVKKMAFVYQDMRFEVIFQSENDSLSNINTKVKFIDVELFSRILLY